MSALNFSADLARRYSASKIRLPVAKILPRDGQHFRQQPVAKSIPKRICREAANLLAFEITL